MRKLRAGIVGCGGIANGKHLPAMQKSGLYEVVAFCDIIIERAQETKEKFGTEDAKVFEDYRELLKEESGCCICNYPKPFPCRNLYSSNGGRKRCHV